MLLWMYVGRYVLYPFSCKSLIKLDFFDMFRKILNNKFHENSSIGSRVVPCRQTDEWPDKHDEVNGRFSQFWIRALKEFATNLPLRSLKFSLSTFQISLEKAGP